MAEEKKEVTLKESNTPSLLCFIFSLTICLYFPGLILSIVGLCTAKNYKKDRKVLSDLNPGITVTDNDVYEISSDSYNNGEWYLLIDNAIKVKVK